MPLTRDAVLAELGREQPHLVRLVGLRRRVGDVVRAGEDGVLRRDVDDVAAHALVDERAGGRRETRNEPFAITSCCRSQSASVVSSSELRERQAGVVDDEVDAAEREQGRVDRRLHRSAFVTSHCTPTATSVEPSSAAAACAFSRSRSAITTHAPSAARRVAIALPMPDAAPVTSATRPACGLRLRHPLQLRLLERPVLDAELLGVAIGGYVESASAPRITLIALT